MYAYPAEWPLNRSEVAWWISSYAAIVPDNFEANSEEGPENRGNSWARGKESFTKSTSQLFRIAAMRRCWRRQSPGRRLQLLWMARSFLLTGGVGYNASQESADFLVGP